RIRAAVSLFEIEVEDTPARVLYGLFEVEHGLARLIAQTGTGVYAPRRVVIPIDRKLNGTGDPALIAFVVELFFEWGLQQVYIGAPAANFDFFEGLRIIRRCGLHSKLGQRTSAVNGAPWAAIRQVGIHQELQPYRGDAGKVRFGRELH